MEGLDVSAEALRLVILMMSLNGLCLEGIVIVLMVVVETRINIFGLLLFGGVGVEVGLEVGLERRWWGSGEQSFLVCLFRSPT